jgi:hypothetical protein
MRNTILIRQPDRLIPKPLREREINMSNANMIRADDNSRLSRTP